MLVDRAICEVGEDILQISGVVAFGWEANDTFFEQVDFQRPHLRDQDVNTHVPLRTTDQQRVVNVLLDHTLLIVLEVLKVANNCYFSTSGEICGLADPHLFRLLAIDGLSRE